MNVLITGINGFIGKNLELSLRKIDGINIIRFSRENSIDELDTMLDDVDFIYHLAGVNRTTNNDEFYSVNSNLTSYICKQLIKKGKSIPILYTSSSQVSLDNDYGLSKKEAEATLINYSNQSKGPVFIYRLPGVFGKWCLPNFNSVVATWCYNIARDMPIFIDDGSKELELVYIDDVVKSFVERLESQDSENYFKIDVSHLVTLKDISLLLKSFRDGRGSLEIPNIGSSFCKALYSTYLTYLPEHDFSYLLKGHEDDRGSFFEFLKSSVSGQFSISTTKPGGIVRGNHYHHTKTEKFLVVSGEAKISLRKVDSDKTISYLVSSDKFEVVEMIPGYTHNIVNTSEDNDLVLLIWANEIFDEENPDTYFLEV